MTQEKKSIREFCRIITQSGWFRYFIVLLILLNAFLLGLEGYPEITRHYGNIVWLVDEIILSIFVIELLMRLVADGKQFWRKGWNLFDFCVITISFLPQEGAFSVLRVLRILRLFSAFPKLRIVVEGLLASLPGLSAIFALMLIVIYVFAIISMSLFGTTHPEYFGTLHTALFTHFQIMTLEGWPDIVKSVIASHPWSWAYFILYILLATYMALNLFIAVIVDSIQTLRNHRTGAN